MWNLVFKSQINYFQSQIKDSGSSSTTGSASGKSSGMGLKSSASSSSASAGLSSQKRAEAQASLVFFLDAARGFYTKLLQDIVITYDANLALTSLPFCQRYASIFDKIDSFSNRLALKQQDEKATNAVAMAKEKQVFYICQHILTHLGDIARYANLYEQAKNYYLHAIKLVPYLGQPYNQLGILYETSRTNQLSTAFYYIRSIAVRYTFPLAATNLDNFFRKLADIPLSRYHPSLNATSNVQQQSQLVKLPHKDIIHLFLQINAFICLNVSAASELHSAQKISTYVDVFKASFNSFTHTPGQRDKLDSYQLTQMISILMYTLSSCDKSELTSDQSMIAVNLLLFLLEQMVDLYVETDGSFSEVILPSVYLIVNFARVFQDGRLFTELKMSPSDSDSSKLAHNVKAFARMLNSIAEGQEKILTVSKPDYPLNEDRMLESFLPLAECQKDLNFKKYMRSGQQVNDSEESELRIGRIVEGVEKLASKASDKSFLLINFSSLGGVERFLINTILFPDMSSKPSPITKGQKPAMVSEEPKNNQLLDPNSGSTSPQSQQLKKKRKNVAIASMTQRLDHSYKMPANTGSTQPTAFLDNPTSVQPSSTSFSSQQGYSTDGLVSSNVLLSSGLNGFPLTLPNLSLEPPTNRVLPGVNQLTYNQLYNPSPVTTTDLNNVDEEELDKLLKDLILEHEAMNGVLAPNSGTFLQQAANTNTSLNPPPGFAGSNMNYSTTQHFK